MKNGESKVSVEIDSNRRKQAIEWVTRSEAAICAKFRKPRCRFFVDYSFLVSQISFNKKLFSQKQRHSLRSVIFAITGIQKLKTVSMLRLPQFFSVLTSLVRTIFHSKPVRSTNLQQNSPKFSKFSKFEIHPEHMQTIRLGTRRMQGIKRN